MWPRWLAVLVTIGIAAHKTIVANFVIPVKKGALQWGLYVGAILSAVVRAGTVRKKYVRANSSIYLKPVLGSFVGGTRACSGTGM